MLRRLRGVLRRAEREPDPLVKVAGLPSLEKAETCLEMLRARGIEVDLREDEAGTEAWEVWVRSSVEPLARLTLGLSGRSVIRVARPGDAEERSE
jgi:hypothetical protein